MLKQLSARASAFGAASIILAALILRLLILALGWPQLNSDEGTMGIMALHIAYQGKFPLVFYGQDYMGTIEAYLGAFFFHLFGPTEFALRLGMLLLYTLFLVALYLLVRQLYHRSLALLSLLLLSLGGHEILLRQLEAVGGAAEVMLFGTLLLLVAAQLTLTSGRSYTPRERRRRALLAALWGLLAGLALWSDPLVAPFVLVPGLLLAIYCWRELRILAPVLLLGLLIGVSPYLLYKALPTQTSASMQLFHSDPQKTTAPHYITDAGQVVGPPTLWQQATGMFLVSLPVATGANSLCTLTAEEAWPLPEHPSAHVVQCTVVHAGWSTVCIGLWLLAVWLAVRAYRRARTQSKELDEVASSTLRQEQLLQACRLAILGSAGLTLGLYTLFPSPATVPWSSTRYLIGLFIAVPAVIAPLWLIAEAYTRRSLHWPSRIMVTLRYALLLTVLISQLSGSVLTVVAAGNARAGTVAMDQLISTLIQAHSTHLYSDYWTCNRIIFQSRERIICSVVDEQLQPALDRYLPYRTIVAHDPHPSFLFHSNAPQVAAFTATAAQSHLRFRTLTADGYIIYQLLSARDGAG